MGGLYLSAADFTVKNFTSGLIDYCDLLITIIYET